MRADDASWIRLLTFPAHSVDVERVLAALGRQRQHRRPGWSLRYGLLDETALETWAMLGRLLDGMQLDEHARARLAPPIPRPPERLALDPVAPGDERPRLRYAPGVDPRGRRELQPLATAEHLRFDEGHGLLGSDVLDQLRRYADRQLKARLDCEHAP